MNDHIISRKKVVLITGKSSTTIWRDVNAGIFPPPRQIGRNRIGWLSSEIQAWMESRPIVKKIGSSVNESVTVGVTLNNKGDKQIA